jgi:hypothetical protein
MARSGPGVEPVRLRRRRWTQHAGRKRLQRGAALVRGDGEVRLDRPAARAWCSWMTFFVSPSFVSARWIIAFTLPFFAAA